MNPMTARERAAAILKSMVWAVFIHAARGAGNVVNVAIYHVVGAAEAMFTEQNERLMTPADIHIPRPCTCARCQATRPN